LISRCKQTTRLHQRLANRFGGRQGRAATLLFVAGLLLVGVPSGMLGSSFAGHVNDAYTVIENDAIEFKQPDAAVPEWPPVIGAVMPAVG
jgi:hypothetical protein